MLAADNNLISGSNSLRPTASFFTQDQFYWATDSVTSSIFYSDGLAWYPIESPTASYALSSISSSYAATVLSSSYAGTASILLGSIVSASFAGNSLTSNLSGNQTITGNKTFTGTLALQGTLVSTVNTASIILNQGKCLGSAGDEIFNWSKYTLSGSLPWVLSTTGTLNSNVASYGQIVNAISGAVFTYGNQNIAGNKEFSGTLYADGFIGTTAVGNNSTIIMQQCQLVNAANVLTLSWQDSQGIDILGNASVDWSAYVLSGSWTLLSPGNTPSSILTLGGFNSLTGSIPAGIRTAQTLYTPTAAVTVGNTATPTTIISTTSIGTASIAASKASPGNVYHIYATGYLTSTGTPTLGFTTTVGTVTASFTTGSLVAITAVNRWEYNCYINVYTTGSSGTIYGQSEFDYFSTGSVRNQFQGLSQATKVVNTTTALPINVKAIWGTANASNTLTCTNFFIEQQ